MVLLVLVVVSMLGLSSAQIGLLGERSARNDRDQQIAWQAAEAALLDADIEMSRPTAPRYATFYEQKTNAFLSGCGSTQDSRGLCSVNPNDQKAAWLTVNYLDDNSSSARTTEFGEFTGRPFANGILGIQPVKKPRYVIEPILDLSLSSNPTDPSHLYRVTAMGFGPRVETQAVLQMIYRP